MKTSVITRTSKIIAMLLIMIGLTVPVWAQGDNGAASSMSPLGIVASVVLMIGLVILFAAKGSHKVSAQK